MHYTIVLYFILSEGVGYIPPQEIKDFTCGFNGPVVGLQVDRIVNPSKVLWPDPNVADKHCEQSISERVVGLEPGEYHLATTELTDGSRIPYIGIDPHTSVYWKRVNGTGVTPKKPSSISLKGQ